MHRDIKPANILISSAENPRLCVCDMGMTKRRDSNFSMSTSGEGVGTIGWRGPELCPGSGAQAPATEASDIFAVALVIFHMYTGGERHVFDFCGGESSGDDDDECASGAEGVLGETIHPRMVCLNARLLLPNLPCWTDAVPPMEQLQHRRQHRIEQFGQEWTRVMGLDAAQEFLADFVEQLQDEDMSNPFQSPRESAHVTGDAACLLGRMLHPDPKQRPKAGEALADLYFQTELTTEDELSMKELKIGGIIGDGAFGVVFRAKWRETDVAIKRLKPQRRSTKTQAVQSADFKREVQLLKRLRHPHVVLFMGWFLSSSDELASPNAEQSLCLVTELCWTSLDHCLHESKMQLPWGRVLGMALDGARVSKALPFLCVFAAALRLSTMPFIVICPSSCLSRCLLLRLVCSGDVLPAWLVSFLLSAVGII